MVKHTLIRFFALLLTGLLLGLPLLAQGIPLNSVPITAQNVASISQLGAMGAGSAVSVLWSPSGDTVAVGTGAGVWLYNATDLSIAPRRLAVGSVTAFDYSHDGTVFAVGMADGMVKLVMASDGMPITAWQVQAPKPFEPVSVVSVSFSHDDKLLAVATSRNRVGVYEISSQQPIWETDDGNQAVVVRFSPDDKLLAIGNARQSVDVRDTLSGKIVSDWALDSLAMSGVTDLAFSPLGDRLLIGGGSERVLALDTEYGERAFDWYALTNQIQGVDWTLDGTKVGVVNHSLIDSSQDVVQIWNAQLGGAEIAKLVGHEGIIRGFGFSPTGDRAVTVSDDGTLRLWDVASGSELGRFVGHFSKAQHLGISSDGQTVTIADGAIRVWDVTTGTLKQSLKALQPQVFAQLLPNTSLVSIGKDFIGSQVQLWLLSSGTPNPLTMVNGAPQAFALSADGAFLAISDGGMGGTLVQLSDGAQKPLAPFVSCAFKPDGSQIATGNGQGVITLWSGDASSSRVLTEQVSAITALSYAPQANFLASGDSDGIVRVWDLASDFPLWRAFLPSGIKQLAFSADGSVLAILMATGELQLYDAMMGVQLPTNTPLVGSFSAIAFNPAGNVLFVAGNDGILYALGVQ